MIPLLILFAQDPSALESTNYRIWPAQVDAGGKRAVSPNATLDAAISPTASGVASGSGATVRAFYGWAFYPSYSAPNTPPAVSITETSVSSSSATISGTAYDNVSVAVVRWFNAATGASGSASGTASWTASVPLGPGSNAITVTAADGEGLTGTATVTLQVASWVEGGSRGSSCGLLGFEILGVFGIAWILRRKR